jgi:hypothetical protein
MQWMESMWSKESFYTSRISRNSLDPEMLMGGWDTLSMNSMTGLQFFIRNAIQNLSHNLKKIDLIGNLLPDSGAFHFSE